MQFCLGIHQCPHCCALCLFNLPHQSVNSDIAFPFLGCNLIIPFQAVQKPAVAFCFFFIFGRQCLKIFFQFPETLFQGIEAVTNHLQGCRGSQLLQYALYLSVRIPDCLHIGYGHLHLVVTQDSDRPAVFFCQLQAQIFQNMVHAGKCLLHTVAQVSSGCRHQLLITCLSLLIILLQNPAFVINCLQGSAALPFCKHAQHVCRQARQLVSHIADPAIILIFLHRHGILGEILACQLVLCLFQSLYQFLHGRGVNGKSAFQQFHIHFCRHAQSDFLQLPSGRNIPHAGFPQLTAVIIIRNGRRFLI